VWLNNQMDIYETRRRRLRLLIDKNYQKKQATYKRTNSFKSPQIKKKKKKTTTERRTITEDSARKIETASGKPHGWLDESQSNVSQTIIATRRVPLISLVAAGTWSEAMDNFQVGDAQEWIETTASVTSGAYALRVEGDSMEPKFPHGAILIVDPNEVARNGSYVIVRQNGSDATFKQLVIDGGESYLRPLNDRYPIMAMRKDAVICGVVKRVEMDV